MWISHLFSHLMGTVAVVINALLFIKNSFLPKLEILHSEVTRDFIFRNSEHEPFGGSRRNQV